MFGNFEGIPKWHFEISVVNLIFPSKKSKWIWIVRKLNSNIYNIDIQLNVTTPASLE